MEHKKTFPSSENIAEAKRQKQALTHAIAALRMFARLEVVDKGGISDEEEVLVRAQRQRQALAKAAAALEEYSATPESRTDVEGAATGTDVVDGDLRARSKSA
jgi:hypothetical protein